MASIENKDIIKITNVRPIIRRYINIYSIYSFQSILITICRLFWLPPWFNHLWACEVSIFITILDEYATEINSLNKILDLVIKENNEIQLADIKSLNWSFINEDSYNSGQEIHFQRTKQRKAALSLSDKKAIKEMQTSNITHFINSLHELSNLTMKLIGNNVWTQQWQIPTNSITRPKTNSIPHLFHA